MPISEFRRNIPWSLMWLSPVRAFFSFWLVSDMIYWLGFVWPLMFGLGAVLFTPFGNYINVNPLHWRSFGSDDSLMAFMHQGFWGSKWADFSNHHTLNLIMEAGLCFGLAGWFAKRTKTGMWRWGMLATYGAVLTWCIHEGMWWLTYWALWQPAAGIMTFSGFGEMITFALLVFTPALGLYAPKKFLVWMLAFQLVWVATGFAITESYVGNTSWYGTDWGDGWEVASWAWATVGFYLLERKGILAWSEKVSAIISRNGPSSPSPY